MESEKKVKSLYAVITIIEVIVEFIPGKWKVKYIKSKWPHNAAICYSRKVYYLKIILFQDNIRARDWIRTSTPRGAAT